MLYKHELVFLSDEDMHVSLIINIKYNLRDLEIVPENSVVE